MCLSWPDSASVWSLTYVTVSQRCELISIVLFVTWETGRSKRLMIASRLHSKLVELLSLTPASCLWIWKDQQRSVLCCRTQSLLIERCPGILGFFLKIAPSMTEASIWTFSSYSKVVVFCAQHRVAKRLCATFCCNWILRIEFFPKQSCSSE